MASGGSTQLAGGGAGDGDPAMGEERGSGIAAKTMRISEALCFLFKKRGRYANKDLKSLMFSFYSGAHLAAAKELLAESVAPLKIESIQKSLRRRRDSKEQPEVKIRQDIDDLFNIATCLDENKLLEQIPTFVAADPDLIPSARLGDGDMIALLNKIDKLDERFSSMHNELESTRSTMHTELENMRSFLSRKMGSGAPGGGENGQGKTAKSSAISSALTNIGEGTGGARGGTIHGGTRAAECPRQIETELSSARESEYDTGMDDESGGFTQQRSARRAAKRRRAADSPKSPSYASVGAVVPTNVPIAPKPSKPPKPKPLIGQSTTCPMKAAKNLNIPKAVYRIGNIDATYTAENLSEYVQEQLGVHVISCYERTSPNSPYSDNKSFWLCIAEMDKDKLLCANNWSVGISITRWVFKPKIEGEVQGGGRVTAGIEGGMEVGGGGGAEAVGGVNEPRHAELQANAASGLSVS